MTRANAIETVYLLAAIAFILALKGLSSPRSARMGNWAGAVGMVLAIGATFGAAGIGHLALMLPAIGLGAIIGVPAARGVKMTAIPQMVAAFNGVGGGAAALVSLLDFMHAHGTDSAGITGAVVFSAVVGAVSFSGSVVTFLKLQELITGRPVIYPGQRYGNGVLVVLAVALGIVVGVSGSAPWLAVLGLVALAFGVAFVLPIGGADVPVVISLLNSFTGLAVAASGFVLHNVLLIVAGTLVGASGTLLTRMMSSAMGRSLPSILFGAFAGSTAGSTAELGGDRTVRRSTADDVAVLLSYSRKVTIVPGYGLAVAQAQHVAHELTRALESRGVEVTYAIHPVAGRMPGHMNVLLAEANVPYEQLKEMDEANSEFARTDVALVVGANDVVNPAARDSPGSPIYGMPILNVEDAGQVIFLKRSMRPGFAGIDNELLYRDRTTLLFGDAKETLSALLAGVKAS